MIRVSEFVYFGAVPFGRNGTLSGNISAIFKAPGVSHKKTPVGLLAPHPHGQRAIDLTAVFINESGAFRAEIGMDVGHTALDPATVDSYKRAYSSVLIIRTHFSRLPFFVCSVYTATFSLPAQHFVFLLISFV